MFDEFNMQKKPVSLFYIFVQYQMLHTSCADLAEFSAVLCPK